MTNLAWTRAVLDGAHVALDEGATKVLKFMIDRPDGCDAWIRPGKLVMQFGPHSANHSYTPELAPAIVSWLLDNAPGGYLPAGTLPWWSGMPGRWSYGPRNVWIDATIECVTIMIRDASARDASAITPLPLPPFIEAPPEFIDGTHPCPHCDVIPERYRKLRDGALVCLACGASSRT